MSDKSSIYGVNSDGEAILRTSENATGERTSIYGVNSDGKACMRVSSDVTSDDPTSIYGVNGSGEACVRIDGAGGGGSKPVVETLNVTPTTSAQTITASGGVDGYSPVNVSAVDSSIDANITAENIKKDVSILGVTGTYTGTSPTPATKFGVSLDNLLGNVDENGVYQLSDAPFTFDATSIKKLPDGLGDLFTYKFYKLPLTGTVDLSNYTHDAFNVTTAQFFTQAFSYTGVQKLITPRERYGSSPMQFYQSFQHCDALKEIVFSNPIIISTSAFSFSETFQYCDFSGASINFDIITSIGKYGFYGAFKYCKLPEEIRFTNLTEITDTYAFREAFSQTTGCKRYFFPSLTSVTSDAFGSSTRLTWYNAKDVEEIHFRADMQATIEAVTGYSSKFGAPSTCTIYFDL